MKVIRYIKHMATHFKSQDQLKYELFSFSRPYMIKQVIPLSCFYFDMYVYLLCLTMRISLTCIISCFT